MRFGEGGEEKTRPCKEGGSAHLSLARAMEELDEKSRWLTVEIKEKSRRMAR